MIEELKLLIPLLQQAGEGVFWVVLTYFGLEAFKSILWFATFCLLFYVAYKVITYSYEKSLKRSKLQELRDNSREYWLYSAPYQSREKAREFFVFLDEEVKKSGED